MSEQQDGLGRLASEVDLQVIAELFGVVKPDFAAKLGELLGDDLGEAVGGRLVVAGDSISTSSRMVETMASRRS